jgi:ketosteroid isomerase-like protein
MGLSEEHRRQDRRRYYEVVTKWIIVFLSGLTLAVAQPAPSAAAREVLAASDALKQAMMKKDAGALQKRLHEDLTYSHSSAHLQTKADVVKATLGQTTIEAMDFSDATVRVYGTTGLIRANVDMRNSTDGKSTTSHLNILFVWLKGPGGWQLVARQATQVSPPTTP